MSTTPEEFHRLVLDEIDWYQPISMQVFEKMVSIDLSQSTILPYHHTDRFRIGIQDETIEPQAFLIYEDSLANPYVTATFDLQNDRVLNINSNGVLEQASIALLTRKSLDAGIKDLIREIYQKRGVQARTKEYVG